MKGKGGFRKTSIITLLFMILLAVFIGYYIAAGAEVGATFLYGVKIWKR